MLYLCGVKSNLAEDMKKLFVLVVGVLVSLSVDAQTLRDLWLSMPDSLMPTLDKNLRLELVDLVDMKVKPEVKNLLGEECAMDTLVSDFLEVSSSPSSKIQMKLLPRESGDSLLCIVRTLSAPAEESELKIYDRQWNELAGMDYLPSDLFQLSKYLRAKPDTLGDEQYHQLISLIEPVMVSAKFDKQSDLLIFNISLPLVSNKEKEKLNAILLQRKFKWNGKRFNEN